jgi:hypothetical protein
MLRDASPGGCDWKNRADRAADVLALRASEAVDVPSDFILKE